MGSTTACYFEKLLCKSGLHGLCFSLCDLDTRGGLTTSTARSSCICKMDTGMMACGAQKLLCLVALIALSTDWFLPVVIAQDDPTDAPDIPGDVDAADPAAGAADVPGDTAPSTAPECREEQFPCTRLYSVHKPVKQCISYLCVTSVRRTYMINKEICSRIVCKEDEAMQEEICRQMAGLPPRRLRRSGRPRGPPCRRAQLQRQNAVDPQ
uniref:microfibrillar-associated protein 5 isoform X2 n=1 Tax=Podarcis muralis TaxID=64176 RepID=UPI0010A0618E|nr:microfibrillar-associated protein 5 isoform X2 [Podarcis muralis]